MLKRISTIVALIISLTVLIGLAAKLDGRWAKAQSLSQLSQSVQKLAERLDQKILADRQAMVQERIWRLEDRYGSIELMPLEVRDEYRRLKVELEELRGRSN